MKTIYFIPVGTVNRDEVFVLLKISFWWYTLMGMIIVLVVGTLVSLITGRQDPSKLDPRLLSPILRCGSKKDKKEEAVSIYYHQLDL